MQLRKLTRLAGFIELRHQSAKAIINRKILDSGESEEREVKILFFIVHPAKFHLFKHTINILKHRGHQIDTVIINKDVLEDLVISEGWDYANIFPEGRRKKKSPSFLSTCVSAGKTVWRLASYTKGKKYDLFITDDLLVVIGKLKKIPTLLFQDDDVSVVPESAWLMKLCTKVVSPACSHMGRFKNKKIAYQGNHELAYLHPKYFAPDHNIVKTFNPDGKRYSILRLVSLTATHDRGKHGIINQQALKLISLLKNYGNVFITSERPLPPELEKYRICIDPEKIAHALAFADLFIGDSQTMTSEAAVLGTPSLRFNDFVGKISYLEEEEHRFGLTYGFPTNAFDDLYAKAKELLGRPDLKDEWSKRRDNLLNSYIDVTKFIVDLIEKYPIGQKIGR